MSSTGWIFFFVVTISSSSQQPTFFRNTFKGLNGIALRTNLFDSDEIRAVYYYDQTVAVVTLGNNNELYNCNLIEVYEEEEAREVLRNLSSITVPQLVSFREMINLMEKCELLDSIQQDLSSTSKSNANKNVLSLFNGILPGTKWCGTGDIAENYHDLGQETELDICCRSHDLCPVKVRARQTRYNLTNYSIYTKSHCVCDEALYNCLKSTMHSTAKIMGQIYFNVMKVPCIEDVPQNGYTSIGLERRFIPAKMYY
ncbi:Phospholipase A2 isozymes PA3A/PA3B/PA5 [Anthophora quadrimaculata]